MTRALLVLLAGGVCLGCSPAAPAGYYDGRCDSSDQVAITPGQTVEGYDPDALLQPLFGTWSGPLEWRSDGTGTELTLSVARDLDEPLYFKHCSGPPGAHTYVTARVSTTDGALNDAWSAGASADLPSKYPNRFFNLVFSGLSDWEWQGTIADKIPGLERYDSGYVLLELARDPVTLDLLSGVLTFTGERSDGALGDTFELGTWQVQ